MSKSYNVSWLSRMWTNKGYMKRYFFNMFCNISFRTWPFVFLFSRDYWSGHILTLNISNLCMQWVSTDLFINNGTLDFANTIKTIDHIGLIFSGIHINPMLHAFYKFGNDIKKIKVIATILVKDTKNV